MARRGKTSIMMPRSNRRKAPPSRDAASKPSTAQSTKAGRKKSALAAPSTSKGKMHKSPGRAASPAKPSSSPTKVSPNKSSPSRPSPKRSATVKTTAAKLPSPPSSKSLPLKGSSGKKAKADTIFASPSPTKLAPKGGRQDGNSAQSPRRTKTFASSLTPVALRKKDDSFRTPSPARPSPLKKRHATASRDGVNTAEIIEGLREKFQQLNMLRTTAAEALLQEYKRSAEERIGVAEKLIESLKKENETLKRRLSEQETSSNPAASTSLSRRDSDVSNLTTDRPDALRPMVELYRQLSGLQISADLDSAGEAGDSLTWHCLLAGRQGGNYYYLVNDGERLLMENFQLSIEFSFDLTLEEAESQYRYAPTFPERSQIASRLPAYLMEEITFDCDQIQLFFWRALNFLMTTTASAGTK